MSIAQGLTEKQINVLIPPMTEEPLYVQGVKLPVHAMGKATRQSQAAHANSLSWFLLASAKAVFSDAGL